MYAIFASYSRICLSALLLTCALFGQEQPQDTPLPGMRGVPQNIPDISLVGDITAKLTEDRDDLNRNNILVRGMEFALQGYLYPEMRADAFFAFHRHGDHIEAELCEGYASFLNLPGGLNLIVGKKHADFGKVNKLHQHHVPYVDRPLILSSFFSEHGLVGEGASLDYLLPLPFFVQVTVGTWKAAGEVHTEEEHAEDDAHFALTNQLYTSRAWASFPLGDQIELELGGSGVIGKGPHHMEHKDDVTVVGLDLTIKAWPSAYQRLLIQGEILQLTRKLPDEQLKRWGYYGYLGYRFTKYWEAGIRYDWVENAFPERELSQKLSASVTDRLTETTKLRLQYGYLLETDINEVVAQLVFGIGPHSHQLE